MEKSLTIKLVHHGLFKILNISSLAVGEITDVNAVDRELCQVELPLVSHLATHSFENVTHDLAQQTINGHHDKCKQTESALKYLLELLNLTNRAGRMAALKLVVEITNFCIDAWQEPSRTFMTASELEELVSYLFKNGIENRWNDVGSYHRSYILSELTNWYTKSVNLVSIDQLVDIIAEQMLDLSPNQASVRVPAIKQLVTVCKYTLDRTKVTQILQRYHKVLKRICECTTDKTGRRCIPYAFELLDLEPRPEREWVIEILNQYVNELASINNVQAAVSHILVRPHDDLRLLVNELSFGGPETLVHFGQCLARFKKRSTEKCLSVLLGSKGVATSIDELTKFMTIFSGFSRLASPDYVYDIVAFQVGEHRYPLYPLCIDTLMTVGRRNTKPYGIKYFNIVNTIFSQVGRAQSLSQENMNGNVNTEWIPVVLQGLGDLVKKWDFQAWEDGGKHVLSQVSLVSVPLSLAGYVLGHTKFKRVEETRCFLLLLTTATTDYEQNLNQGLQAFLAKVSTWNYDSFAERKELMEVTTILLDLCSSLYRSEGKLPPWFQHKLNFRQLYSGLAAAFASNQLTNDVIDKDLFDKISRNLYILEKLKCTCYDLCISSILPQIPFESIKVHINDSQNHNTGGPQTKGLLPEPNAHFSVIPQSNSRSGHIYHSPQRAVGTSSPHETALGYSNLIIPGDLPSSRGSLAAGSPMSLPSTEEMSAPSSLSLANISLGSTRMLREDPLGQY